MGLQPCRSCRFALPAHLEGCHARPSRGGASAPRRVATEGELLRARETPAGRIRERTVGHRDLAELDLGVVDWANARPRFQGIAEDDGDERSDADDRRDPPWHEIQRQDGEGDPRREEELPRKSGEGPAEDRVTHPGIMTT